MEEYTAVLHWKKWVKRLMTKDIFQLWAVKNAYNKNILCVMAAGNKGNKSITSPGDSIYKINIIEMKTAVSTLILYLNLSVPIRVPA